MSYWEGCDSPGWGQQAALEGVTTFQSAVRWCGLSFHLALCFLRKDPPHSPACFHLQSRAGGNKQEVALLFLFSVLCSYPLGYS